MSHFVFHGAIFCQMEKFIKYKSSLRVKLFLFLPEIQKKK